MKQAPATAEALTGEMRWVYYWLMRKLRGPISNCLLSMIQLCAVMVLATACQKAVDTALTSSHPESSSPAEEEGPKRLAWNLKTLVEPYGQAGHTNPKWDESARRALVGFARSRSGVVGTNEPVGQVISTNILAAMTAGCDDPMVNYLFIRFSLDQTNSKEVFLEAYCKTARDMSGSSYPPVRKFYASLRALHQVFYTFGTNSARRELASEMTKLLSDSLRPSLADKTMPAQEAYDIASETLSVFSGGTNYSQRAYEIIEPLLVENWPEAYTTWLWKGEAFTRLAWNARGSGWASTVTDEGWELFRDRLATAEEALKHAWSIYPKDKRICDQMMTVTLGQGGGRDRMEVWFNRAMELDPNDHVACQKKLYYLEPKWYGSIEDQLAFGRECVRSKWGGQVPLALVDAHQYIMKHLDEPERTNYWRRAEVWPDIQAAFERFFELNPDWVGWYHNYAWYAYQAEQWSKLNELIPKLGPINYAYFGGRLEFEKMLMLAKEHAADKIEKVK